MISSPQGEKGGCSATTFGEAFDLVVVSPDGLWDPGLPIAAARAGELGLLNLLYLRNPQEVASRIDRLMSLARGRFGLVMHGRLDQVELEALEMLRGAECVVLTSEPDDRLAEAVARWRGVVPRIGLIVTCERELAVAKDLGLDFVIAKGHEAGGHVGAETTFVLVQRLLRAGTMPVYAWGGMGLNTAAACQLAGAAGAVLDWQLSLTRESAVPAAFRRRLSGMDGSETVVIPTPDGRFFRLYSQPGMTAEEQLRSLSERISLEETPDHEAWQGALGAMLAEQDPQARLWAMGQDGAFATFLGTEPPSVARVLALFRDHLRQNSGGAIDENTVGPHSPFARSHRTTFPVMQGPMTRVSDVPEFCDAVAAGGALPFLALALLREAQVRDLLERTRDLLGDRPWGVGILGFVDRELRAEQIAVVEAVRPPFAIIAGGRPDQAASLEAKGIATYLHIPSPGLLDSFIREGSRRFIFEGRECGGHIGPRSSFVLWETMIHVLLKAGLSDEEASKVHIAFAGGIHDGLSAAMVAALAQPLVRRGMKVGVLLGTAYLFTDEAVRTGAILPGLQEVALECDQTVLVETGPGHAIRCANTDFIGSFEQEKRRLKTLGRSPDHIREELERMNMGRLRIASKGIVRLSDPKPGQSPYAMVDETEQRREGMYMIGQIAALRSGRCTILELHQEVSEGAALLLGKARLETRPVVEPAERVPPPLDIAVIGMSCLLPGATTIDEFWQAILAKHDLIEEVPARRFDIDRWYHPDKGARDKINSRWGGFLGEVAFEPLKYGIPPAALPSIEPGQLLALELVERALRDAGYLESNPARAKTSVIFGVSGGVAELGAKYVVRSMLPHFIENPDESLWSQLPEWTEDSFAGILPNVVAGRISNRFDLGGMNFTVDAACASSLAAVYLACRSLADGTSDMAIAGGCDTVQNAHAYLCFAKSGALSPRGRSRAFDATADGIAISEGLASVVLKRREDAERDGDRIYAIIRGVAGSSDGRSKGLTSPRVEGQIQTIQRALAQADIDPATLGLIEAHGTGTAVGDATECQALRTVLNQHDTERRSVALGSVKSIIGHTKSAAGVAGLIKAALALHHRVLPPTNHVETPNPKAGLDDGPLYVNSELRPWIRGESPRRAGVSSFGFGGTNFHAVLEEHEGHHSAVRKETPHRVRPAELFVFASRSPDELLARARGVATEIERALGAGAQLDLADLAFTLHCRHTLKGASCNVAIVAVSPADLLGKLQGFAAALTGEKASRPPLPPGVHFTDSPMGKDSPVAFLFPGQGAQFPDMMREIAVEFTEVAACFEHADAVIRGRHDRPLSRIIFPPPAFSDRERSQAVEDLKATDVAQPALGACGLGMRRLLESFGIRPQMAGGHSYGELVALCAAGAIDEAALYQLSLARGRAMLAIARDDQSEKDLGAMLAAHGERAAVVACLNGCEEVWIANHNSPRQIAVSGSRGGIALAVKLLEAGGISSTPLPVGCGFHSPFMESAQALFEQALAQTEFRSPRLPVYSNVSAETYPADVPLIRELLRDQLVREVRFVDQVEAMYLAGARVFVELGPNRVVSKFVDQILGDRPHLAVATQVRDSCGITQLLNALATLVAHGVTVDLERLYEGRALQTLDLRASSPLLAKRGHAQHAWLVDGATARPAGESRQIPSPQTALHPPTGPAVSPNASSTPLHSSAPETTAMNSAPTSLTSSSNGAHSANGVKSANGTHSTVGGAAASKKAQESAHSFTSKPVGPENGSHAAGRGASSASTGPAPVPHRSPPAAQPIRANHDAVPGLVPVAPSGAHGAEADAYAQFQYTMRRFLRTQERVLESFFNITTLSSVSTPQYHGLAEASPAGVAIPWEMPLQAESPPTVAHAPVIYDVPSAPIPSNGHLHEHAAIITPPAAPGVPRAAQPAAALPKTAAPSPAAPPAVEALETLLGEIAGERTGYPPEMLGLDANLEADLGIDSIKRVEIIGAFRRAALPDLAEPPSWFMEGMAEAKTLRAIVAGVARLLGGAPAAATVQTAAAPIPSAPAPAPSLALEALESLLGEIAGERTGYPTEMLGLDANLEADLGIDSIKRVEIIGAFRRAALPDLAEPPSWFMEEMAEAKTLRAIVAGVARLLGGAPAGAPVQTAAAPISSAPAHAAPLALEALESLLGEIAGERTGYPTEMLGLDANLEADLGIDSIKRVEIIGAFRRAALPDLAEPPSWFMEEMAEAKTLRAIVAGVARLLGGAPASIAVQEPTAVEAPRLSQAQPAGTSAPRCVGTVMEVPLESGPPFAVGGGVVVITNEGHGIAQALADELDRRGRRVALLSPDQLASRQQVEHALAGIRQAAGPIGGVVHLLPLREAPCFPALDPGTWSHYAEPELKGLLFLLQAVAPELNGAGQTPIVVAAASIGGGDFGGDYKNEAAHPWRGGLAGIMKTAAQEWRGGRFRMVDFDEVPDVSQLLDELGAVGPVEIGYREGRRLTVRAIREELPVADPATPFVNISRDSIVLVLGGAQGITSEVATEVATRTQATIILVGRSPLPPATEDPATAGHQTALELRKAFVKQAGPGASPKAIETNVQSVLKSRQVRGTLALIRAAGSRVEYYSCDVRDPSALGAVIEDARRRIGEIDVVIHGAGVIDDRAIVDKTENSFDLVLETKVQPLLALCQNLDPEKVKLVILFSSISAFFGNSGQVDYAAANEVLNRVARRLRDLWPGKFTSINWGPWSGSGMVTSEVAQQFAARGVEMVTVPAGRRVAWQEILHRGSQDVRVIVGHGPWIEGADRLAAEASAPPPTPLLAGQTVLRRASGMAEARVILDADRQSFLRDHKIDGKPVLPLTVALELIAEVAAAAQPAWHVVKVRNMRMFSGVVFEEGRRELIVEAEPIERDAASGEWRVRITAPGHPARPLYQAMVHLAARRPTPPAAPAHSPLEGHFPLSVREAYRRWLFHGPSFWMIEKLRGLDASGIDATLGIDDYARPKWIFDPIMLDVGPQLATLWSQANHGTTILPNQIATYHHYSATEVGPVEAILRVRPGADGDVVRADVWFVQQGRVVGQMEGLEGAGSADLNRIVGVSLR